MLEQTAQGVVRSRSSQKMWTERLATLVVNKIRGALKVAAVKAPDLIAAKPCSKTSPFSRVAKSFGGDWIEAENATVADLGTAEKITIDKDNTTVVNGAGDKAAIQARGSNQSPIETTTSDYDREKLQERLAKLAEVLQCSTWPPRRLR